MKKLREMPKQGFYVLLGQYPSIVYTTGVRGKGGHKYWRPEMGDKDVPEDVNQWATLLWTCVPGRKRLQEEYIFASTIEEAILIYKGF
jgi:hypothetical protein